MADIFEDDELAAEAVTETGETAQEDANQTQDRQRDEQGRFAPKADEPVAGENLQDIDKSEGEPQAEGDQQQRQVPQGALHAERERRKGVESQLRQAQEQLNALAAMRQQIAARQSAPTAIPEGEDPTSETAYLRQRLEELEGTTNDIVQRDQMSQVDAAEHHQLNSVLTQSEAEFRTATPDYDAAINHIVQSRAQELQLYGLSPAEVNQALRQEVLDITRSAIQQGKSPAEVGYQLAKLRGYRPEAAQGQQQPGAGQRIVEAVGTARAASRSLGQTSGTGSTRDLDANSISKMSPDEFDALYSTPEGRRMIDAL